MGRGIKYNMNHAAVYSVRYRFALRLLLPLAVCWMLAGCGASLPQWGGGNAAHSYEQAGMQPQTRPAGQAGSGSSSAPVHCMVGQGAARFARGWYPYEDTRFTLRDDQRVNVSLRQRKGSGNMVFQSVFDVGGQKILFCPVRSGPPGQRIVCASLYMLEDDLKSGIKRTFVIPDGVQGATISCAYDRSRMLPL
jgi:hypothetical protein